MSLKIMEWNKLTTKQRVLWVAFLLITLLAVGVLGVIIYKQLTGGDVSFNNWFSITLAACALVNTYFALTHSKKTSES